MWNAYNGKLFFGLLLIENLNVINRAVSVLRPLLYYLVVKSISRRLSATKESIGLHVAFCVSEVLLLTFRIRALNMVYKLFLFYHFNST